MFRDFESPEGFTWEYQPGAEPDCLGCWDELNPCTECWEQEQIDCDVIIVI